MASCITCTHLPASFKLGYFDASHSLNAMQMAVILPCLGNNKPLYVEQGHIFVSNIFNPVLVDFEDKALNTRKSNCML